MTAADARRKVRAIRAATFADAVQQWMDATDGFPEVRDETTRAMIGLAQKFQDHYLAKHRACKTPLEKLAVVTEATDDFYLAFQRQAGNQLFFDACARIHDKWFDLQMRWQDLLDSR